MSLVRGDLSDSYSSDSDYAYGSDQYSSDDEDYVYPWPTSSDDSWASVSSEDAIQKILLKLPTYDPGESGDDDSGFPSPSAGLDQSDSLILHESVDEDSVDTATVKASAVGTDGGLAPDSALALPMRVPSGGPLTTEFLELYEGFRMLVHPSDVAEFQGYLEGGSEKDEVDTFPIRPRRLTDTARLSIQSMEAEVPAAEESPVETPLPEGAIQMKLRVSGKKTPPETGAIRQRDRKKKSQKKKIVKIGDTVDVRGRGKGVIRWVGKLDDSDDGTPRMKMVGVELTETGSVGDNNGSLNGVSYFKCPAKKGMFTKLKNVSKHLVRHVKVARSKRHRKNAELFGDFYGNLMTARIRKRRDDTAKVARKPGPREIGRMHGWKGGDDEYGEELKRQQQGDFLDSRLVTRSLAKGSTEVVKKTGPREEGVVKGYRLPDYDLKEDGDDFLKERVATRKKKPKKKKIKKKSPRGRKATDGSSDEDDGVVRRKLGPRDMGKSKYKGTKYDLKRDEGDFLTARTRRQPYARSRLSDSSVKVERKPGPSQIWAESRRSAKKSPRAGSKSPGRGRGRTQSRSKSPAARSSAKARKVPKKRASAGMPRLMPLAAAVTAEETGIGRRKKRKKKSHKSVG